MAVPGIKRLAKAVLGPASTRRLTLAHSIDNVADAILNLSLVGSLFFSVSFDASRLRILLYLVLTAAPLALIAPVVGPVLDRTRIGYRTLLAGTQVVRIALAAALASSLGSLTFYPLLFGVLLCRKVDALAKAALLAQLSRDEDELVIASGHLARVGTLAAGVGTAMAGLLLAAFRAEVLPAVAAAGFLTAAAASVMIPPAPALPTALELPVVAVAVPGDLRSATVAVSALKAAAGALTFLLALAIKRGSGDAWVFATALVAAGAGSFLGTTTAPRAHRLMSPDRVIVLSLFGPGLITFAGVLSAGHFGILVIAAALGMGEGVANRSIDLLYRRVPVRLRARAISRSQLRFQLANVAGASLAVLAAPGPRVGFAVVAALLVVSAGIYASIRQLSLRGETGRLISGDRLLMGELMLARDLRDEAEFALVRSRPRVASILTACADRIAQIAEGSSSPADVHAAIDQLIASESPADPEPEPTPRAIDDSTVT